MARTHQVRSVGLGWLRHATQGSWAYSSHVSRGDATPGTFSAPTRAHRPPMPVLPSTIDTTSDTFRQNESAMSEGLALVDAELAIARAGGGERYVARHRERGKMTARERIELLLDRDTPFLE